VVLLLAISVALSLNTGQYLTFANLFNLLNTSSVNLIFAVGLLVVLISGGIDISFAVALRWCNIWPLRSASRLAAIG
jgi:simple sugar transport system permease protein